MVRRDLRARARHELRHLGLPIEESTRTLIDLANNRGGKDNITAIVVEVEEV